MCLLSFEIWHTEIGWILRSLNKGGKCTGFFVCTLKTFGTLGVHNAVHVTIDWQIISPLIMGGMLTGFNRSLCMALWKPRLPNLFKVQTNTVLLFGFSPVAILISTRFQRVTSQMREDEFLFKFIIYCFWVEVIPLELWLNSFSLYW